MIDIHAHLCWKAFDQDREKVIEECKRHLAGVIVSSARYPEGVQALEVCEKHKDFLFPTLGFHPTEGGSEQDAEKILELIRKNKERVKGVGECGLDYHWEQDPDKRERQKEVFRRFIALAKELKKPLVIHSWDAEQDCFEMVRNQGISCVFHCFSGGRELALEILKEGFYISISTQICFSKHHKRLAKLIPLDKLLLETDAPFLSPQKHGGYEALVKGFGPERNYPWNILLSAEKIAGVKGLPKEEVLEAAKANAVKVFRLKMKT